MESLNTFVVSELQAALRIDTSNSDSPINRIDFDFNDPFDIFDDITYSKGKVYIFLIKILILLT